MNKEKTIISKLEMFDALMENIPDSIYFKDLNSRFIRINKALAERLKINNSDEAIGKTDYDFFTKEHADKAFLEEQNIIKTNTPLIRSEEKETYVGGKDKWVSTIKMLLYDEKRKIIGTFGISRDITERKTAEEEIKSLAKFPDENPNLVARIDYTAKLLYCNHAYKRTFNINDTISDKLKDVIKKTASEKISTIEELEIEMGDKVFLISLTPIKGENYINLYGVDITERKKAETLLAESEEKFRILFNTSTEGILITEIGTQKIKYANPSICKMLGYTEKELTEMDSTTIHSKEDLQGVLTEFKNQVNIRETETLLLRKDGTNFYAAINRVIITINGQKYGAGFFHDITERKKTEEEILFLSYHDQLTGLYNRRFFEEEKKRLDTKRQLPASIIMADVDGLKYVNDNYGHEKGDKLLIAASEIIKNSCRKEDIIARIGGDEFIIFLPKTKEADALDVIYRIRKASRNKMLDDKINISISLGLSTKNDLNETMDHIIEQADKNMYADKASKKIVKIQEENEEIPKPSD